jgi:hypothetical protein
MPAAPASPTPHCPLCWTISGIHGLRGRCSACGRVVPRVAPYQVSPPLWLRVAVAHRERRVGPTT